MPKGIIKVASVQFPVSADIESNVGYITDFLKKASKRKADVIHFPECALSGYAGVDMPDAKSIDWELLVQKTEEIMALAGRHRLWVVLGSTHRLTAPNKPHNCLYLISPAGELVSRYDKRFCTKGDLEHYTPGNRFITFEINGVKCSLLICFDLRFPELYRALKKENVQCIFQSFYNARQKAPSPHTYIMRQTMQCRAATNYFWVSMTNCSARYSPYPSSFIRPDGKIINHLKMNAPGIMINTVDTNEEHYDPSEKFRPLAMRGLLSNGPQEINDPRSKDASRL